MALFENLCNVVLDQLTQTQYKLNRNEIFLKRTEYKLNRN
jgi:hypothetical protein